jgi:hypothetical protein
MPMQVPLLATVTEKSHVMPLTAGTPEGQVATVAVKRLMSA